MTFLATVTFISFISRSHFSLSTSAVKGIISPIIKLFFVIIKLIVLSPLEIIPTFLILHVFSFFICGGINFGLAFIKIYSSVTGVKLFDETSHTIIYLKEAFFLFCGNSKDGGIFFGIFNSKGNL